MDGVPRSADRLLPFLLAATALHGAMLFAVRLDGSQQRPQASVTVLEAALEVGPPPHTSEVPAAPVTPSSTAPRAAEPAPTSADVPLTARAVPAIPERRPAGRSNLSTPSPGPQRDSAVARPRRASSSTERTDHAAMREAAKKAVPTAAAETGLDDALPTVNDAAAQSTVVRPRLSSAELDRQIGEWSAAYTETQVREAALPERTAYVASVRTHRYAAEAYERAWQDKVERVGNLNYPEEARRKNLNGGLLLTVGVNADGTLKGITVANSSGHPELDEAAVRIVRLAAPFAPFPSQLKADYDVLVITRTWRFFTDHHLATAP